MAVESHITGWFQGEDKTFAFDIDTDITGWTLRFDLSPTADAAPVISQPATVTNGPSGFAETFVSAAQSEALAPGVYAFALWRTDSGNVTVQSYGSITLSNAADATVDLASGTESSYSGIPTLSARDQVRFLLGDTGPTSWHYTNGEIDWMIATERSPYLAAAALAENLASHFAATSGGAKSVGDLSLSGGEIKALRFMDLAKRLRRLAQRHTLLTPVFTAATHTEKAIFAGNDVYVGHTFSKGMQDNPGTIGGGGGDITRDQT